MKVIIDRFEEDIAVVELDGEMLHAPRALFAGAREGDAAEITILPHGDRKTSAAGAEEAKRRLEESVHGFFHGDKSPAKAPTDEDPAALFEKLRKKKRS